MCDQKTMDQILKNKMHKAVVMSDRLSDDIAKDEDPLTKALASFVAACGIIKLGLGDELGNKFISLLAETSLEIPTSEKK